MQFINHVQGALSKNICTKLIDHYEINKGLAKPGEGGDKILDNSVISLNVDFKNPNSNGFEIEYCLEYSLYQYKNKFPLLDTNTGKWHVTPTCNLTKYQPNNYYKYIHCDVGKTCRNRILVWMIFLNDIKNGGGTHFIHQDFTAKPISGDLYMWPAGWTHMHVGVNAPNEIKYILTGWVEYD